MLISTSYVVVHPTLVPGHLTNDYQFLPSSYHIFYSEPEVRDKLQDTMS